MFVLSVGDFERSISLQAGFGKQLDIDKKSTDSCLNYLKFFRLTQDALLQLILWKHGCTWIYMNVIGI